MMCRFYISLIN